MKLSARNVLKGKIVEIARASTMTRVTIDIGGGNMVNAAVTTVAIDALKLAVGMEAYAVVDATTEHAASGRANSSAVSTTRCKVRLMGLIGGLSGG